jgi:hypothetical protein
VNRSGGRAPRDACRFATGYDLPAYQPITDRWPIAKADREADLEGGMARYVHLPAGVHARLILLFLLIAQLGDATTFVIGQGLHGIRLESNHFAVAAYHAGGLSGVLLLKGVAIVVTLGVLTGTAHRFPRLLVWGGATATGIGLLGAIANVRTLLLMGAG